MDDPSNAPTAPLNEPPRRVVITRPQPQADEWVARLTALGQPAIALPLLRIEPDEDFAPAVQAAWQGLVAFDLVMFVSPNAVLSFSSHRPPATGWPPAVAAGATGPGTVAALQQAGVPTEAILAPAPDRARFDAEALWTDALQHRPWAGRRVLVVRGDSGRDWLAETLRRAGASVDFLAAYRPQPPAWDGADRQQLAQVLARPAQHAWLFSSSRAIGHLISHLLGHLGDPPGDDLQSTQQQAAGLCRAVPALATHPRIAETARNAGFDTVRVVRPEPAAVLDALQTLPRVRRPDDIR